MKHLIIVALLALGASSRVLAAGYDDFARALTAYNTGDINEAVAAFSQALTDGDLSPKLQPAAHIGRAKAYLGKSDCVNAVSDTTAALALQPRNAEAFLLRAAAENCIGQAKDAEKDVDAVLEIAPNRKLYFDRGRLRWTRAQYLEAANDFAEAMHLEPAWLYSALWLATVEQRTHRFNVKVFEKGLPDYSRRDWPGPILAYYMGERSVDEVYAAAANADAADEAGQKCEADFYVGEWQIAQGKPDEAKRSLQSAAETCPRNFVEFSAAQVELKRIS